MDRPACDEPLCHLAVSWGASMKLLVFLASALLFLAALTLGNSAHATSSPSFEGDGYWIGMEVGDTGHPVLARITFHAPGDKTGVVLPQELVTITAFDPKRRTLLLRYAGGAGVAPFVLSAQGATATLDIDGKQVLAGFTWDM